VDTTEVGREMHWPVAVILGVERHAEGAVEGAGSFSVSREHHDRGHLNHTTSLPEATWRIQSARVSGERYRR
jgi:hypothetical protein